MISSAAPGCIQCQNATYRRSLSCASTAPRTTRRARAAATTQCTVVVGIDPEDRPWLLDVWRERVSTEIWIETWCRFVKHYSPLSWAEERGQILSGVGPFLDRRARELHAYTDRQQFTSRFDKAIRAQSWRGYIATIGLWYDEAAPWREIMEHELLTFPASRHDDIVDCLGLVGQLLDFALLGSVPKRRTRSLSTATGR